MKASQKGWRSGLVPAVSMMAALSAAAVAGPRYNVSGVVSITAEGTSGWRVEGTLGEVRNSSNDAHRISCQQSRSETTSTSGAVSRTTRVVCQARNTDRSVICIATSEALANALSGASNDALLELHISGTTCTDIVVYESSGLIKKS
jgi:hypothetical protein